MLAAPSVWAQEEAEGEASEEAPAKAPSIYIPLKPAFVVNYGGKGRLRYLRAELSVRVSNISAAGSVRHHMPFIRNNLVLLFSRQKDEDIDTQEGKELLRLAALEEVRSIIELEDEESGVVDLYFNNFVIQK
ncbi:flagellar basal body rod protein [Exilibacterium tricleocarpae]|uniref:Flagellar protein FliL n=1 Tax=Exilibacterium tricleocarpae TaxID=2591008 RepID=A0A545TZU8_9GAMM|nr:flagellar basal body rod protein [Exilibacterium tricleocarpae]